MTLQDIKSLFMWLSVFTLATRFIYIVTAISLAASLVYWEWHTSWWILGAAAASYLLTDYLEKLIYYHNLKTLELVKKIQDEESE